MESTLFLKNKIYLCLILIFGLFIFTYRLATIPSGVYVDEAVVGYDALSIATTLKDHYGQILPTYFKFFNSYTPGLYVYLIAVITKLFGLSPLVLRLPSAISMMAVAIGLVIFYKNTKILKNNLSAPLSVLLFIITPWTVFNARLGYETTFAFALLSLGLLFYHRPRLSFFLLSLSTYAGHSQRYLAPLCILIIYFVFYYRQVSFKKLLPQILPAIFLQIPNIIMLFTQAFWIKNSSFTSAFFEQYLSYFSPVNLFSRTDFDLQRSIPMLASFYGWMFFPWVVGLYQLYKTKSTNLSKYIIILIFVLPLPAALANTSYSTQRALPLLLPYSIVIALGVDKIIQSFHPRLRSVFCSLFVLLSLILLLRSYFILFPVERGFAWNTGYDQLARLIQSNPQKHFVIDNSRGIPDILILFWTRYSPRNFQLENKYIFPYYENHGFNSNSKFGNVEVRPIVWYKDLCLPQILVGDNLSISSDQIRDHSLTPVMILRDNTTTIYLQAYETVPKSDCP